MSLSRPRQLHQSASCLHPRGLQRSIRCTRSQRLRVSSDSAERVCIITGGNTGIGKASAEALLNAGAYDKIIIACRDMEKAEKASRSIESASGRTGAVESMYLDLSSLDSVRTFVQDFEARDYPVHCLLNNAGVMACPPMKTADGFEMQFGVNHLGHFLLTLLLLDRIQSSGNSRRQARIINVSSSAHYMNSMDLEDPNFEKRRYNNWLAYGQSKLANVLFTYELNARLNASGAPVTANTLMPGTVNTELSRYLIPSSSPSPLQPLQELFNSKVLMTPAEVRTPCLPLSHLRCTLRLTLPLCLQGNFQEMANIWLILTLHGPADCLRAL
ncbi:hypothetical protein CYMTET_23680 [Cymbomonas tetramitiformis]|uniref:Uncharacterized protein n=1 Tax=Cymbomonas tetramitiformis TaxID=36881 RepID=A0AAE0L111_9CHLO|nr:hypothetical protein CYMTET_23680 [Cymbomonas tetramitiformis]